MSQGINFEVVEMATSRIISAGFGQPEGVTAITEDPGHAVIEAPYPVRHDTHWFDGEFKELMPVEAVWDKMVLDADGVDTATLSGLPVPCQVMVDGVVYDVDDGSLELTVTSPGDFYVWLDHPAHINKGWRIHAD